MIEIEQIKQNVALKATEYIHSGMKVGIGSGSTVAHFINALGKKIEMGLQIEAIVASNEAEILARKAGIPLNFDLSFCDIYIDGADEIDDNKSALKGLGRALFREKIIACMSRQVILVVDETKRSVILHKAPVVCEILPFGYKATLAHLEKLGFKGHLRTDTSGSLILTDNHNYLVDLTLKEPIEDPKRLQQTLKHIPGVLETGLFFDLVNKVLVGLQGGQVIVYE